MSGKDHEGCVMQKSEGYRAFRVSAAGRASLHARYRQLFNKDLYLWPTGTSTPTRER